MTRTVLLLLMLGSLVACSGSTGKSNPFEADEEETTETDDDTDGEDDGGQIDSDRTLPPGTVNPTATSTIVRREAENTTGGGFVTSVTYNNANNEDEFTVDGIAFDGDNSYIRGGSENSSQPIGQLGPFAVYEADQTTTDPVTGTPVQTFQYRAIYGQSTSGQTEFAIVRTGSYLSYGFGGFIYQRNDTNAAGEPNRLLIPEDGDAQYLGDYAGVRVFTGLRGIEYVTGQARMVVDFKDFNDNQTGVALFIQGRRLFDANGVDITASYIQALDESATGSAGVDIQRDADGNILLPEIRPLISPDIADANGELTGGVSSVVQYTDGTGVADATGNFYAIMSGENAEEVVGVLVIEGADPRYTGVNAQETGGFIIYRQ